MKITFIEYSPCTGFGAKGLTAALYSADKFVSTGHGATADEAVLEALTASGLSFDAAFDAVYTVRAEACEAHSTI